MRWTIPFAIVAAAWAEDPLASVRPEVHSVEVREREIVVRSNGLSTRYLGALQARPAEAQALRHFEFHIPRNAPAAPAAPSANPAGVFTNGVPFYNLFAGAAYQDRGLWHFDRMHRAPAPEPIEDLLADSTRHSPILGYTLAGSPVYGPWGFDDTGRLRRMRSSYRLRPIARRTQWPGGLELTPAQEGPPIDAADFPLGAFCEDYEYAAGLGDLDAFNGRFARTPEYPQGVYAYFLSTNARGELAYPYLAAEPFAAQAVAKVDFARAGSTLTWSFRAADGTPMPRLETVHERPLHLMIVSEDLAEFAHIHPQLTERGTYAVDHTFPHGGRYRLYADFTAPGAAPRIVERIVDIPGAPRPAVPLTESPRTLTQRGLSVQLSVASGRDSELSFTLSESDLDPYLGAWGHFAILDQAKRTFIHAHPQGVHDHAQLAGPSPRTLAVTVNFPAPGLYKIWAQFQRQGEVLVFPFTIRVEPGEAPAAPIAVPAGAIRIDISSAGFSPARILAKPGAKVQLAFVRDRQPNCGRKILFPGLGIQRELEPGAMALIELAMPAAGEVRFTCGMGMYRGAVLAVPAAQLDMLPSNRISRSVTPHVATTLHAPGR